MGIIKSNALCNDTINSSRIEEGMYIYHCKYIKAIAYLQLGNYDSARKLLSEIKYKLNYMKVYTKHIICNSDGTPRLFSGKNVNLNDNDNSGGKLDMYTETGVSIKNVYLCKREKYQKTYEKPIKTRNL